MSLPAESINRNVAEGSQILTVEGSYPGRFALFNTFIGDNFSDAIMLNITYVAPDAAIGDTLAARYYGGVTDDPVASLQHRVDAGLRGEMATNAVYARYWHGYLAFTRPVLALLSYSQVRILNAVLLGALLLSSLMLVRRWLGWGAVVSLVVALVAIGAPTVVLNMHFVGVFYVAFGGIIAVWLLRNRPVEGFDIELFLVLGLLTSFVDLSTAPVVTLGLPLLVLLSSEVSAGPKAFIRVAARACAAWALGYVLFWASKWAIVGIFMPNLGDMPVGESVSNRLGGAYDLTERLVVVAKNVANIVPGVRPADAPLGVVVDRSLVIYAGLWVAGTLVTVGLAWLVLARISAQRSGRQPAPIDFGAVPGSASAVRTNSIVIMALGVIPILWYVVVANHSDLHSYFTCRALAVGVFAVSLFFTHSINWRDFWAKDTFCGEE